MKIFGEKNSLVKNQLSLSLCQLFSYYAKSIFIEDSKNNSHNVSVEFLKIIEELVDEIRNARGKTSDDSVFRE